MRRLGGSLDATPAKPGLAALAASEKLPSCHCMELTSVAGDLRFSCISMPVAVVVVKELPSL